MRIPRASLAGVLVSCLLPSGAPAASAAPPSTVLHSNTPQVSSDGHRFTVPAGWSIGRVGPLAVITVPEGGSRVALVDVTSPDADAAVRAAWAIYAPDSEPTLLRSGDRPVRHGWSAVRGYSYVAASAERLLSAVARRHGQGFNVAILDMAESIADKRDAEIELLLGSLMPKGSTPEAFGGITAHRLEGARLATFDAFIERARQEFAVPGAAVGILQQGEIVLAKGYGVRQLGQPEAVDADTRFMIASNTKPLTTLMLAKLVNAGKFSWDTPVTEVMPSFTLGSAEATGALRMRHLVCACTGLPRQDMEWIFEAERLTPASVLELVAEMEPNSPIGALYQYSNLMAGAAGYIGGQVQHPGVEIGAAYDAAMQELVFDPLGMGSTTFDLSAALRGNHARPHALDLDGHLVQVDLDVLSVDRLSRPDGGAWSTVNDLLRYLRMELDYGHLPDGSRYIGTAPLLARRVQQVSRGNNLGYGIGLKIDESTGTLMLHHGGTTAGFISDVIWWPEHDIGAVILTNSSDGGTGLRNVFRRRLMELLFDGSAEAEPNLSVFRELAADETAALRETLTRPVPDELYQRLAPLYLSPELGEIRVRRDSGMLWFDFGGWSSEMASRREGEDDAVLVTVSPGAAGFEFRLATNDGLVLSDGNRDYVFRAEH